MENLLEDNLSIFRELIGKETFCQQKNTVAFTRIG